MLAAVLHTPGSPPSFGEHPDPSPRDGYSLVQVTAAPVVPLDLLCASGTSYLGQPSVPYVPGVQGVGVVVSASRVATGTRVWFATTAGMAPGDGGLAPLCLVRDDDLVALSADVADAGVAALGLSAVAAWMALTWRARFRPGDRVVVLGAGGAVGQVAVGAARDLGAGRVVAVCRSDAAAARAQRCGADKVVRPGDDLERRLSNAVGGGGADVVIDPVFGPTATAAARVLAPAGRLVNLGSASGDEAVFASSVLRSRSAEVLGYTNNALSAEQRGKAFDAVLSRAARGVLSVEHDVLPLAEVAVAWERTAGGRGPRLVLVPGAA